MTKFNFHGKLLENGKQVITNAVSEVEVITDGVTTPRGQITFEPYEDGAHQQMELKLWLPPGPQGERGETQRIDTVVVETVPYGQSAAGRIEGTTLYLTVPRGATGNTGLTPKFYIGNVTYAQSADEPKVTATNSGTISDPKVILDFVLPNVPTITIDEHVDTVANPAEARVVDLDPDKYNAKLHFYIPKGEKGDKGDQGDRFVIKYIFETEEAMQIADAQQEINIESYIIIRSDIHQPENARLWYKEKNGALTFLGDFSGATGTASRLIVDEEVTVVKSSVLPSVESNTEYIEKDDINETTIQFTLPKAASATFTQVAGESVNSNVPASATLTDLGYDEETDTNTYGLDFKIPKGRGAKITQATAASVASTVAPSATIDDLGYTAATDTNDFRLNITVPAGASAIAEPHKIDLEPNQNPTIEVGATQHYEEYTDSKGNIIEDVYVTPFTLGIPRGTVEIPIFSAHATSLEGEGATATAEITYPIDELHPNLELGIPIGHTPIISTDADYIPASESPEAIISYPTDKEHPHILFKIPSGQDGKDAEFAGITESGDGTVVKSISRDEDTHELTVNKELIEDDDIDATSFAKNEDIKEAIYKAIEDIITVAPEEPESYMAKLWIRKS